MLLHGRMVESMWVRMATAAVVGVASGAALLLVARPPVALMGGWVVGGVLFCVWTWLHVGRMNPADTRTHATREDPGRAVGDLVLLVASLGAVLGVGYLIAASAHKAGGTSLDALTGVLAVVTSWTVVHTLFALHYGRLYFRDDDPPIDFNSDTDPTYTDFFYLAFTIGMTYQVSDTAVKSGVRSTVLRHAVISFLLGAVILACTINLVSQLAGGGG
jgi:uncharacterized membrane protein